MENVNVFNPNFGNPSVSNFYKYVDNFEIQCVTHDGMPHSDDLFSCALIRNIALRKDIDFTLYRTRDEAYNKKSFLVFDVFGGEFDHHDKDTTQVDGRKLASFGKLWRYLKDDVIKTYELDDEAWDNIDQSLVKFIDHTDNTGSMNPLSYAINALISQEEKPTSDDTFEKISHFCENILVDIISKERQGAEDRRIINSLPVIIVNGKKFALKEEPGYVSVPMTHPALNGVIIRMGDDETAGKWMIKMCNGGSLSRTGLRNEGDIIFTHPNGFMGKANTLDAIKSVI